MVTNLPTLVGPVLQGVIDKPGISFTTQADADPLGGYRWVDRVTDTNSGVCTSCKHPPSWLIQHMLCVCLMVGQPSGV